ncbi:SH3 domain-containing protein [Phascolomyces articulosus]|uniref:SH3 domain-containing protein n=1 Tax=Phascolomyces articulosus TaxID=60185 RepID=A0AAD5KCW2_9FUNG|nr:SH3 domain-containing protein [Phascolomyces articulosus]
MSERDLVLANYMLASIQKDLGFLKDNQYLNTQTYNEICALLPSTVTMSNTTITATTAVHDTAIKKPPLPTRKSGGAPLPSGGQAPVPAPRSMSTAGGLDMPKLPARRSTNDQQQHLPTPAPRPQPSPRPSPRLNNAVNVMPMPAPTPAPAPAPTPAPAVRQHSHVPAAEPSPGPPPPSYSTATSLANAEAIYDYDGDDPKTDLSFRCGDIIQVTEYVNDDWWRGELHGKSGIFPQNHVKKITTPEPAKRAVPPKPPVSTPSVHQQQQQYPPPPQSSSTSTPSSVPPYSYPPPPTTMYHAPPQQPPTQAYYTPPPPGAVVQPPPQEGPEQQEGSKVSGMAKKFGGKVGEAAVFGFGATLGSQAAQSIF